MSRRRLALGEAGEVEFHPQILTAEGRWAKRPEEDSSKPGRWRARCYYRTQAGELREISRYAPTQTKARQVIEAALRDREGTRGDGRVAPATPFVRVVEMWLERIARSDSGLSKRSVEDYTGTARRYLLAQGSSLRSLTLAEANDPQRLRAFLRHVADHYGNGAAHMSKSVLGGILRTAVEDGAIAENKLLVVGRVKAQTHRESVRDPERAMTRAERDHAVQVAYDRAVDNDVDPRTTRKREATADLMALLAASGARINEARYLRWDDVNLRTGRCHIDGTKSASADRVITLPEWCLARLRARAERLGGTGLVFPAPSLSDPERAWDASNSSSAIRATLDTAGLPWATAHSFRHAAATLMHLGGIPLADIAATLGHRDLQQTMSYIGKDYGGSKAHVAAVL